MAPIGILLVTLGGPRERGGIESFVTRMTGRELPPMAIEAIIARYDKIGGRSPLCDITERQAESLEEVLGAGFICRAGFKYARPSIEDGIDGLLKDGIERLVLLSMSPFWSSFTTADQIETARSHLVGLPSAARCLPPTAIFVHSWYESPFFLAAWAQRIEEGTGGIDDGETILFSAHSVPERLSFEPYRAQIERTVDAVAARLSVSKWSLGWQSTPGGAHEPWIGPTVDEEMDRLKTNGAAKIVQVPIGFTADHIETLYDIDIAHRAHAETLGIAWRRVPSLNDYPPFIRALTQIVDAALAQQETAPGATRDQREAPVG